MYGSLFSSCTVFTLCTLIAPLYLLSLSWKVTTVLWVLLQVIALYSCTAFTLCTLLYLVIRIALNWIKSQYHLGFILLDNRIIIDYVVNRTYILTANETWQIQVNCLLNLIYLFKYPTRVNIIKYNNILYYTFHTQAVNQLYPYAGFRLPPLQEHMLSTFCYTYIYM